ncbi:MAG: hypothetical protein HWE14_07080 [Flavobacteriia bacterium]|nr:hypothetical protein [Flavobacteriia bacterium]
MKNLWSIFKEKVDSTATPMQEGDWKAMETLLDETQIVVPNKGRRMRWGLLSLFAISLIGVSAFLFFPAEQESDTKGETNTTFESPNEGGDTAPASNTITTIEPSTYPASEISSFSEEESADNQASVHSIESSTETPISTSNSDDEVTNTSKGSAISESSPTEEDNALPTTLDWSEDSEIASSNEIADDKEVSASNDSESQLDESEDASVETNQTPQSGEFTSPDEFIGGESRAENLTARDSQAQFETQNTALANEQEESSTFDDVRSGESQSAKDPIEEDESPIADVEEEERDAPEADKPVIRRSSDRTRPFWVEANFGAATSVNTALNTYDGGLAFGYRNNGWTAQVGLQVANTAGNIYTDYTETVYSYDTSTVTRIDTSIQQRVIETWVITGWYTGEYVYDTIQVVVTDTVRFTQTDTMANDVVRQELSKVQTTYIQIPILGGYEWTSNEWSFGVQAGVNFRSVTYAHPELKPTTGYGLDALFRPYVGYSWNDRWTLYLRTNVAVPLSNDPLLNRKNFTRVGLNVGVGYSF